MSWLPVTKFDVRAARLADGHYSRWLLPRLGVVALFLAWGILVATCGRPG